MYLGSGEQRVLVGLSALSWVCLFSVVGTFAVTALIVMMQMREEKERREREQMASRARRLRYKKTDKEVHAPLLEKPLQYHLFLSHVWG